MIMMRMVIADDEWLIRESLRCGINWEEKGIDVVGMAADGLEALELVKKAMPHILLTDIRMPGIDGIELIQQAKELAPRLKTIIISGFGEFEYAQSALKIGANDYILKPIVEDELIQIVERLLLDVKKEESEQLTHYLFKVIQGEIKYDHTKFEQLLAKGEYAFICWKSEQAVQIPVIDGVHPLLAQSCEGIIFVEEANIKKTYFNQLHELFTERGIVGGCSSISSHPEDFHHLYKQALTIKSQHTLSEIKGGLYTEHASPINVEEVIQYIKDNYREAISLQDLANSYYISDSYFSRIFKQHTGKNFIEYVTDFRITKAKDLLVYSSLKTNEVSTSVGYLDQRYFSQIFKRHTGMTPSSYKKKHRDVH